MSAAQENSVDVEKLGIIAGGGALPEILLHACDRKNIEPFIVGFEGQTDPVLMRGRNHMWTRLGAAGSIIKTLKAHDVYDLVLIGSLRRPSLLELRPDLRTAEFFAKIGLKALGDDSLLTVMRRELEKEGFQLHGVHKFAEDLIAQEGPVGKYTPGKEDRVDIRRALEVSLSLGHLDVGQAVIVQEGIVLGVEAAEGTDELIQRCKHLKRKGRKGVLVKTCKPQQDRDFDLPTIGPRTVSRAHEAGLGGVIIHAGNALIINSEEVAQIANKHKMYVCGVNPAKELSV